MIALIVLGFIFITSMILLVIKLSVSCMFWLSSRPKNKQHVFKIYFPYYIIILFGLCIAAIILFDNSLFAIYYFGAIFFITLLIWRKELKPNTNAQHKIAVEPNHPNLP